MEGDIQYSEKINQTESDYNQQWWIIYTIKPNIYQSCIHYILASINTLYHNLYVNKAIVHAALGMD